MKQPSELESLIRQKHESLPISLHVPENVQLLFGSLPSCPYLLINRLGTILSDRAPARKENLANGADFDLIIPVSCCDSDTWQNLINMEPGVFNVWGEQDALISTDNMFFILNPKHQDLTPAEKQLKVCQLVKDQVTDRDNIFVHQISTGESITKIGSKTPDQPFAEIFPLIIEPGQDQEQLMINLGYLPDHGLVAITPQLGTYRVTVSSQSEKDFNPDLSSYASQSPNHAIMFLRRLTKSTIATLRHSRNSHTKEKRLQEYHHYYSEVMDNLISPFQLNQSAQDSMNSLARKVRKLEKLEKKFTQASARPIQSAR